MPFIVVEIPGDPRGQGRPRATIRGKHAGVYTDSKTASYQNLVALAAKDAMGSRPLLEGPLQLTLFARFRIPKSTSKKARARMINFVDKPTKKPDLTNILKAVEDGMNGVVFSDDSQIVTLHAKKFYTENPGVKIWVSRQP